MRVTYCMTYINKIIKKRPFTKTIACKPANSAMPKQTAGLSRSPFIRGLKLSVTRLFMLPAFSFDWRFMDRYSAWWACYCWRRAAEGKTALNFCCDTGQAGEEKANAVPVKNPCPEDPALIEPLKGAVRDLSLTTVFWSSGILIYRRFYVGFIGNDCCCH